MKIILIVLGILAALVLLVVVVGWSLPVRHRASRQATYTPPPETVFEAITKFEEFPQWRSKVQRVEMVDRTTGAQSFREIGSDGSILYSVDEALPGQRLVTSIADKSLPFGGKWTYELTPTDGGGTQLRITEDGEVYNPIYRFMSKFVFSHHATIDAYLTDLGKKFGNAVEITE